MWPFGVARRGEASNHLMLRWLKTVVVSDEEKAQVNASGGDWEDERRRTAVEVSKHYLASKPGCHLVPGMSLAGVPFAGQAVPGMKAA